MHHIFDKETSRLLDHIATLFSTEHFQALLDQDWSSSSSAIRIFRFEILREARDQQFTTSSRTILVKIAAAIPF